MVLTRMTGPWSLPGWALLGSLLLWFYYGSGGGRGGSVSSEPQGRRKTCPWAVWMLHLLGHGYPRARSHPPPRLEGSLPLIGGWRGVSTWESKICRDRTPRGVFFVISRVWRLVSLPPPLPPFLFLPFALPFLLSPLTVFCE